MWKAVRFFLGSCRVRISGASPEMALERLSRERILVQEICRVDDFCVEARILRRDAARAAVNCARAMCAMDVLEMAGFGQAFRGLRRRWIFAALLAVCIAAGYVIPKFVFFYRVSGNDRVPAERILRELQELGVGFGTYGPRIKPQELKNRILRRIPELQWLTVTQNGMCAEVVVRERPEEEPILDRRTPKNVVASRAGVITEVLCLEGNCLVAPGQAVTRGQLLVSAYTDLEFKTQVSAARAEIYAKTVHETKTLLPDTALRKEAGAGGRQVALLVGERRIFLWQRGGNCGGSCDKITKRRMLTLPGGYSLPVGIEITEIFAYDTEKTAREPEAVRQTLEALAGARIRDSLIAGTAEEISYRLTHGDGCFLLVTRAECEEMIAWQTDAAFLKDGEP